MAEAVFFYLFSGLMLLAALSVVLNRHPIYSVLSLLLVMFCLASLFVMLGAYFIAAIQILLYAGAVLVLFLFATMLLNLAPEALARLRPFTRRSLGMLAAGFLLIHFCRMFLVQPAAPPLSQLHAPSGSVEALGRRLFSDYLLPFELTSFLILAAIIGAVTLSRHKPE